MNCQLCVSAICLTQIWCQCVQKKKGAFCIPVFNSVSLMLCCQQFATLTKKKFFFFINLPCKLFHSFRCENYGASLFLCFLGCKRNTAEQSTQNTQNRQTYKNKRTGNRQLCITHCLLANTFAGTKKKQKKTHSIVQTLKRMRASICCCISNHHNM